MLTIFQTSNIKFHCHADDTLLYYYYYYYCYYLIVIVVMFEIVSHRLHSYFSTIS